MTAPAAFTYHPGRSLLHRLDVRYKFVLLCGFSLCILYAGIISIIACLPLFFLLFLSIRYPLFKALMEIKLFLLLIGMVFFVRAVSIPGTQVWSGPGFSITDQGILDGFTVAGRFFLLLMAGLLFSVTTRPGQVKGAVQWLLRPVPFIPEKKIGVMIGLSFGFLPIILKQYHDIKDAQNARCAQMRRNPLKKAIYRSVPLLEKSFRSADHLAMAMTARCYNEDRTDPEFSRSGRELPVLIFGILVCVLILIF